jgi:hypothetical protein
MWPFLIYTVRQTTSEVGWLKYGIHPMQRESTSVRVEGSMIIAVTDFGYDNDSDWSMGILVALGSLP